MEKKGGGQIMKSNRGATTHTSTHVTPGWLMTYPEDAHVRARGERGIAVGANYEREREREKQAHERKETSAYERQSEREIDRKRAG